MSDVIGGSGLGQQGFGEASLSQFSAFNLLAWTGCDSNYTLNISTSTSLSFASNPISGCAGNSQQQLAGPAIAVMPNGMLGYAVFVNASQNMEILQFSLDQSSPPVVASVQSWVIANSKPSYPPTAQFGLQDGQFVLNIVWEEGSTNNLVLCQLQVGNEASSLAFSSLPNSNQAIGAPCLASAGSVTYLAWTGTDNKLNLVSDPAGGVNFNFSTQWITNTLTSSDGCAYVPMNNGQGYFLVSTSSGVAYQQVGLNQTGQWEANSTAGCSGTITGSPVAGPTATYQAIAANGGPQITVVWCDSSAGSSTQPEVLYTTFVPSTAPIPV